ncbi:hypothetical protein V8E36_004306 [Tilletia maclaganii]
MSTENTPPGPAGDKISYISASVAASLDQELMHPDQGAFSLDQLMELAGLACAQAVFRSFPPDQAPIVLVACGPGNQGGDGLVAARHLLHFGYTPRVWYPKRGKQELFSRLVRQLANLEVEFVDQEDFEDALENADVVLDAIFGFSFKGEVREPFREPLELLKDESRMEFESRTKLPPIVSVDIPSAWDVNEGNINNRSFTPQVLISLTAPKLGVRQFQGRHFLGGRFLPPAVAERYGILLPPAFVGGGVLAGSGSLGPRSRTGSSNNGSSSNGGRRGLSANAARIASEDRATSATRPSAQPQSSSAAAGAASSSSSSAAPAPATAPSTSGSSAYYGASGGGAVSITYDDSQIIEITGAEAVPLLEPTPIVTPSTSVSQQDDDDEEEEDAQGEGAQSGAGTGAGAAAAATTGARVGEGKGVAASQGTEAGSGSAEPKPT